MNTTLCILTCVERAYIIASTHGLRAFWCLHPTSFIESLILLTPPYSSSLQHEWDDDLKERLKLKCVQTVYVWKWDDRDLDKSSFIENKTVLQLNAIHSNGFTIIKRIFHTKIEILSSFTHRHVFPNLSAFISSVEDKRRYWRILVAEQFRFPWNFIIFLVHTMEVNGNWNCLATTIL